ncbi:unnamed protein product [Euphydryas editha]|uniref:Tc1-like transposase DDE domain-containing protein n=1 Tax=Euphydryas editha TaxID=104508 RepID=A0AAU9U4T4_EUPED|nr:unnamed protein product [Euphydryas editha]
MSYDNYIKWLNEKLLPNLPERSIIVLDNASYHNTRAEKMPTSATNKADMQQWLRDKGIAFERNLLKLELYDIIKKHKDQHITYKIDDFIKSKGFDVIRLPPYHPELNAIENIWGINIDQNTTNMETLINESLNKVTSETWYKTCTHVEKIEKEYLKYFDVDFEFVIDLQNDSDDSESEFENYVSDSD